MYDTMHTYDESVGGDSAFSRSHGTGPVSRRSSPYTFAHPRSYDDGPVKSAHDQRTAADSKTRADGLRIGVLLLRHGILLVGVGRAEVCLSYALAGPANQVLMRILPHRMGDVLPGDAPCLTSVAKDNSGRAIPGDLTADVGALTLSGTDARICGCARTGSEFRVAADLVLIAMGFTGPRRDPLLTQFGVELTAGGTVRTDDTHRTTVPGVFATGDARRGASLIVWAIKEGRVGAASIDTFLPGSFRSR